MSNERLESLRQLGAKHWKILVSVLAGVPAVAKVLYDVIKGPATLQTWILISLTLVVLLAIRFPSAVIRLARLIFGSSPIPTDPSRIFRGPLPYLEGDHLPGRQADVDECFLLLQQHTFFVLEGESGCGKTSILNAALLPQARTKFRVVECRVANDPIGKLYSVLLQQPYHEVDVSQEDLSNALKSAISTYATPEDDPHAAEPVLLCIDQFEELFVTVKDEVRVAFLSILRDAIRSGQLRLLLSIRNDFLDLLINLCRKVDPTQLILNLGAYYRLEPFSEVKALAVLTEMLEPIQGGDPVRRQEHDDFARKLVFELLLPPRDSRLYQDDVKTVLPVELQIVGTMIESVGIENFSVDGLRRLGGKTALTRAYVEEAKKYVWRKTGVSGDSALLILRQLITPARTNRTRTPEVISKDLNIPAAEAQSVLDAFAERFLVKRMPDEAGTPAPLEGYQEHTGGARYELIHEHLLAEAPQPILQRARDAEERLHFWRQRARDMYSLADETGHGPGLPVFIRQKLTQPIPFMESLRLWRFATSREDQQMLRRNLRGFSYRFGSVATFVFILLSIWIMWTRSDSYQIASIVGKAPVDQLAGAESPTQVVEWIKALIYANKVNAAFEVAHKIKNTDERSKAFAVVCLELTALDEFEMAKTAVDQSLFTEGFSWVTLHSEAIVALVPHMPPQQFEMISSGAFRIEDYRNQTQFLAAVAEGLFRAGKHEQANQVFTEAIATAKLISDSEQRFQTLIAINTRLIHEKRIQDANAVLEIATSIAEGIDDKDKKFGALLITAEAYAKVGNSDKAANVLKQALTLDPNNWNRQDEQSITSVTEDVSKAGKKQMVLDIVRNAKVRYYKDEVLAATAAGLCTASEDDEVLAIFDEISSNGKKFYALVDVATNSIGKSRVNLARRLLERASPLLSQPIVSTRAQNPWGVIAMGMLRVNEIDKAIEIGRFYEQKIGASGSGLILMDDERLSPLARIAKKLAQDGKVDRAYEISKDIKLRLDMYHALTAVVLADIKAGNLDRARHIQAQLLAIPKSEQRTTVPGLEEEHFEQYLMDIAVAFAGANKLNDALVIVSALKRSDDKYTAFERIAKELIKLGKTTEAINVIDRSDAALRSRSLANLVEWLLDTGQGDTIPRVLALIAFGDDKSRASAALAKFYARSGSLRLARYTADSCTSQSDQLSAYTAILNEYAKRRNPKVAARLKTS